MQGINKLWNAISIKWGWVLLAAIVLMFLAVTVDSNVRELDWSLWAEATEPPGPNALTLWGRSLWEWADLLLVPLVLAIGGFLLQRSERKTDREIAEQTRLDKTLDDYLSLMKELIVKDNLLNSKDEDPLRDLASTLALTTIRRLDNERNRTIFRFLWGVQAIKEKSPVVTFEESDLSGANLEGVNLYSANFTRAEMNGANLRRARLTRATLKYAKLSEADLRKANLEGANLEGAKLVGAKMLGANVWGARLEGVTWPDETRFEEHGDNHIERYTYVLKFARPKEWKVEQRKK